MRRTPEEEAAVADVEGAPRAVREVVEGEAGGGSESAGSRSVGVGRLDGLEPEAIAMGDDETDERRVDGAVPAEEGRIGDEAAEGGAGGGGAGEVGRGGDPEEDLLPELVGEVLQLLRQRRGFGAGKDRLLRRRRHSQQPRPPSGEGRGSELGFGGLCETKRMGLSDP